MSTVRLTTGQALVRWLSVQHGVRDGRRRRVIPGMFGIFGHGNVLGLGEALAMAADAMPFHQPKHEQAMVHAALGYAKATRRLSTFACTASIGPGALNLVTGAGTATTNRLPVLLLPADTFASRRQGPVLQQLQHPSYADWTVNDALRPVSRFFDRIARPEQLLTALPEAMRVLLDPAETGAVTIAVHQDVLGEAASFPAGFFEPRTWTVARRPPADEELTAAARVLAAAERPLVVVGGGVRHSAAEDALRAFADAHGLPCAETSAGKGAAAGAELALGGLGVNGTGAANAVARRADAVLCVGTRLSDFTTASQSLFEADDVRFVGVNVHEGDARRMGASPVVADARLALDALDQALGGWSTAGSYRSAVLEERERWKATVDADLGDPARLRQSRALRVIEAATRPGDWIVAAAGSPPGDLLKLWHPPQGSRAHIEFGFSCMGHEIPAAIGIRMAEPEAGEIVAVIGDGTYLMAPTELVTAVQEGLKVTVVVLVNGAYGSIEALQRSAIGIGFGNALPVDVDYAANARSLGCAAWHVEDADGLADALREARDQPRSALIACRIADPAPAPPSGAWWDLGVPEVSADQAVAAAAEAHAAGARRRRFRG
jgi:3D-(3,5/4)-trihydroxycyclohexane-1,2-dione acylhydrolase (decyclizing)